MTPASTTARSVEERQLQREQDRWLAWQDRQQTRLLLVMLFEQMHPRLDSRRPQMSRFAAAVLLLTFIGGVPSAAANDLQATEYRLLATNKTSTMQKEMNEAADAGYRFAAVMGGDTAIGGNEVVTIMVRPADAHPRYEYKLLATTKTSTMQKEMQEAGDAGFEYRGQTVFESMFGGQEVAVVLERDREATPGAFEYRLLATNKTSTMQKELTEAGTAGYEFVGMTVANTGIGGAEVVVITRRPRQ